MLAQKHSTSALRAVELLPAVNLPKARTRQQEPEASVWAAKDTPPVVGVVVLLMVVTPVRPPAAGNPPTAALKLVTSDVAKLSAALSAVLIDDDVFVLMLFSVLSV